MLKPNGRLTSEQKRKMLRLWSWSRSREPCRKLPFCVGPRRCFQRIGQVQAGQKLRVNGRPLNTAVGAAPAKQRRPFRLQTVQKPSLGGRNQKRWGAEQDGLAPSVTDCVMTPS